MKRARVPKAELVYFKGCPSVPKARQALERAGLEYTEIVQDELAPSDPKRGFSSPTLLIDGKPVIGGKCSESACSMESWDPKKLLNL